MPSQPSSEHETSASESSEQAVDPRFNDPNWKNNYELLEYFLDFVNTKNEVLSILAGYFSKLLNSLFANKKTELCKYLYNMDNNAL